MGALGSSGGYLSTFQTEIANIGGHQEGDGGRDSERGGGVTHMRMSCALSRSLLLAELMKMPSSSVVELLEDNRLCRPTRPFQPRPGEALHTQPAPRLGTFTRASLIPDVSLIHVSLHSCPHEVNFDVKIPRSPLINRLFPIPLPSQLPGS